MNRALLALPLTAVLVAAGCSHSTKTPAATVGPPTTAATAASIAPAKVASPITAASLIAKFKAAGLPVGPTTVYTAATDPNSLLGRPNGYVAKIAWTDTSIPADKAAGDDPGDVDFGGSIEQFTSAADARARGAYIEGLLKATPMLGTEYEAVVGACLVRVSQYLTPAQFAAYRTAAG